MNRITNVICPYMKGTIEGARCAAADQFLKDMQGFTIKLCMSRHYEACAVYAGVLKEAVVRPAVHSEAGGA